MVTFKSRCGIAVGGKLPDLPATCDFVLALQTAKFWAEAGSLDPARKEVLVDFIQYGLRGHAAWGICKDVQDGFLNGRR